MFLYSSDIDDERTQYVSDRR